jgi:hypothetical protein
MLFIFGGLPKPYCGRLADRATRELREHYFTYLPLEKSAKGYVITQDYCSDLLDSASKFIRGRPASIVGGVGTLLLLRPWERDIWRNHFCHFSLYASILTNEAPVLSGSDAKRMANTQIDEFFLAARLQMPAAAAISQELSSHGQRTPLLLPLRHFGDARLNQLLDEIEIEVRRQPRPHEYVRKRCKAFEATLDSTRHGRGGRSYVNGAGVVFSAPGRALHGSFHFDGGGRHNSKCHLTALARIGGAIADGFHYVCTARNGGPHSGAFANCHDEIAAFNGQPHLNVYPNDFIRQ